MQQFFAPRAADRRPGAARLQIGFCRGPQSGGRGLADHERGADVDIAEHGVAGVRWDTDVGNVVDRPGAVGLTRAHDRFYDTAHGMDLPSDPVHNHLAGYPVNPQPRQAVPMSISTTFDVVAKVYV